MTPVIPRGSPSAVAYTARVVARPCTCTLRYERVRDHSKRRQGVKFRKGKKSILRTVIRMEQHEEVENMNE
jgi:hypothetical protein